MLGARHLVAERSRTPLSICAVLAAFACSSPRRDLGQTDEQMSDEMRSSECEERGAPKADDLRRPQASLLSDFVGLWLGQAEDALGDVDEHGALPTYSFPSGSTRILLEVSHAEPITAKLTFGASEPSPPEPGVNANRSGGDFALTPAEGLTYAATPIASAFDMERAAKDGGDGELEIVTGGHPSARQLAFDGKLVLAFAIDDQAISELHLRLGGDGLIGVFDGLRLLNERGFETRPGSVRFRRGAEGIERR